MGKCPEKPEGIFQAFNIVLHVWGPVRIAGNLRLQAIKSQTKIYKYENGSSSRLGLNVDELNFKSF